MGNDVGNVNSQDKLLFVTELFRVSSQSLQTFHLSRALEFICSF